MNADGSRARRVTSGRLDTEPAWSPDGGRRIAYVRRDPATGPGWQVFWMRPNGSAKRRVTLGGSHAFPTWSPDSRWIAVARNETLAVVRADGTGSRRLTGRRPGFTIDGIDW